MPEHFLVLGEALVDVVVSRDGAVAESVGGSPTNLAVALARLGNTVELAAGVGSDRLGRLVVDHLRSAGVRMAVDPHVLPRTSTAVATIDEAGVASYQFEISGSLPTPRVDTSVRHVHTGSIGAVLAPGSRVVVDAIDAHRPRATVSYDVNARPAATGDGDDLLQRVERIARRCDLVKASDEDLEVVYPSLTFEQAARRLLELGPAAVVVTRGAAGATCFTTHHAVDVPGVPVVVADTIAAGDSFCAGVIDGLARAGHLGAEGRPRLRSASAELWHDVLLRAATASAITVSRPGADPPTLHQLSEALGATALVSRA